MKKNSIILVILLFTINSLKAQNWTTNVDKAQKIAQKENKKIIMSFQGSDWCAPCIKLEKEFFSTDEFVKHANDNFVLLKVDFPRKKKNKLSKEQQKHNGNLAEKYNRQGNFPLVVVLDKDLKVLGKTGYNDILVNQFIKKLTDF